MSPNYSIGRLATFSSLAGGVSTTTAVARTMRRMKLARTSRTAENIEHDRMSITKFPKLQSTYCRSKPTVYTNCVRKTDGQSTVQETSASTINACTSASQGTKAYPIILNYWPLLSTKKAYSGARHRLRRSSNPKSSPPLRPGSVPLYSLALYSLSTLKMILLYHVESY